METMQSPEESRAQRRAAELQEKEERRRPLASLSRPHQPAPPITLAKMSMVAQVSMSCMDTGVCPSALASRISTSCSAFSLNVSIRLTKELGKQCRWPLVTALSVWAAPGPVCVDSPWSPPCPLHSASVRQVDPVSLPNLLPDWAWSQSN